LNLAVCEVVKGTRKRVPFRSLPTGKLGRVGGERFARGANAPHRMKQRRDEWGTLDVRFRREVRV
jgi:hypothetical protein